MPVLTLPDVVLNPAVDSTDIYTDAAGSICGIRLFSMSARPTKVIPVGAFPVNASILTKRGMEQWLPLLRDGWFHPFLDAHQLVPSSPLILHRLEYTRPNASPARVVAGIEDVALQDMLWGVKTGIHPVSIPYADAVSQGFLNFPVKKAAQSAVQSWSAVARSSRTSVAALPIQNGTIKILDVSLPIKSWYWAKQDAYPAKPSGAAETCRGCDGKGRAALPPTWESQTCPDCGGSGVAGR